MDNKIVVPKRKIKGEDGYSITSIRLPQELFDRLNKLTASTELSRNEVITILLSQALDIAEVEDIPDK